MHADHADLLAFLVKVVDGFTGGLGDGTHADDDALGVVGAIIAEEFVIAARNLGDFGHILLDNGGHRVVVCIAALAMCEEGLGILSHTAGYRMFGRKGTGAELAQRLLVDERTEVLLVDFLNLLVLVGGAETVKEVNERHAALNGSQVGDSRKVHHLLHRAFAQHGEARLAAGHDVAVVTEDTQGVSGQRAGRHVEHAGQQFAGNLVHVGNHQQQTLRRGERGRQRAGLQRTVYGTGRTAFGLHFLYRHGIAEKVLATLCGPLVDVFRHGRRRCDGVDSCDFREHIRDMRSGLVAITSDKFLFLCHNA